MGYLLNDIDQGAKIWGGPCIWKHPRKHFRSRIRSLVRCWHVRLDNNVSKYIWVNKKFTSILKKFIATFAGQANKAYVTVQTENISLKNYTTMRVQENFFQLS